MKVHTPEQLDQLRGFINGQVGEERSVAEIGAISARYAVVNIAESARPFRHAVAAAFVPEIQHAVDYEIAVSDDVPQLWQPVWAAHEYYDFTVVGHGATGRCSATERVLLSAMQEDDRYADHLGEYVDLRAQFYADLEDFMDGQIKSDPGGQYERIDTEGAAAARVYLGVFGRNLE
jgi:hypothetical protein